MRVKSLALEQDSNSSSPGIRTHTLLITRTCDPVVVGVFYPIYLLLKSVKCQKENLITFINIVVIIMK